MMKFSQIQLRILTESCVSQQQHQHQHHHHHHQHQRMTMMKQRQDIKRFLQIFARVHPIVSKAGLHEQIAECIQCPRRFKFYHLQHKKEKLLKYEIIQDIIYKPQISFIYIYGCSVAKIYNSQVLMTCYYYFIYCWLIAQPRDE